MHLASRRDAGPLQLPEMMLPRKLSFQLYRRPRRPLR